MLPSFSTASFLLLTMLCAAQPASAAVPVYRVGVEEIKYYPAYEDDHGEFIGYSRELLDGFAKSVGIAFEYVPMPVSRLFQEFLSPQGSLDFKYPDNENWQQAQKLGHPVLYSETVLRYVDGVLVRPENLGKGMAELHLLGILRGFTPVGFEDAVRAGRIRLQPSSNFSGLLQQVMHQRMDGAYMNVAVARYQLGAVLRAPDALVYDPGLPHVEDRYKLSTLKYPELILRFNHYLRAHVSTVRALQRKYHIEIPQ
jgi:hypothetical protein